MEKEMKKSLKVFAIKALAIITAFVILISLISVAVSELGSAGTMLFKLVLALGIILMVIEVAIAFFNEVIKNLM